MSQVGLRQEMCLSCVVQYDLDPWSRIVIQGHCTPYDKRRSLCEVWTRLDQGEKIFDLDKYFSDYFLMTLPLTMEFGLRSLYTFHVKAFCRWSMSQIVPRERRYALDKRSPMDSWKETHTGHYSGLQSRVLKNLWMLPHKFQHFWPMIFEKKTFKKKEQFNGNSNCFLFEESVVLLSLQSLHNKLKILLCWL